MSFPRTALFEPSDEAALQAAGLLLLLRMADARFLGLLLLGHQVRNQA